MRLGRYAVRGGIAACLAGLALAVVIAARHPTDTAAAEAPRHEAPLPSSAGDTTVADLEHETALLTGKPRAIVPINDLSAAVRTALNQGNYAKAEDITKGVVAHSRVQAWTYYPFHLFISNLIVPDDDSYLRHLNGWVSASADDPVPLLVRADYYMQTAWLRRGGGYGSRLTRNQSTGFAENLTSAIADIQRAVAVRDDNPYAYMLALDIMAGQGDSPQIEAVFQRAIAKFPSYFALYEARMQVMVPKWGGSIAEMYAFADRYAGHSAPDSPLRVLYLALYDHLLETASDTCDDDGAKLDALTDCVTGMMKRLVTPQLEADTVKTLKLYDTADKFQFSAVLGRYLGSIVSHPGGLVDAGAILQLAADATGSDNQLVRDAKVHGNAFVDSAAGDFWVQKGDLGNAEVKYRHAMQDIETTTFPDEQARLSTTAAIYRKLARLADTSAQYAKVIPYTEAAVALEGDTPSSESYLECKAFFYLHLYEAGTTACTRLIGNGRNLKALFWRGRNEDGKGDTEAALADLHVVAETDAILGGNAVLEMSVILGHRKDYQAMLDLFGTYADVFDEAAHVDGYLAAAYNNRCFAYMNLGQIENALADCTRSLHFGSSPDAFAKQQQLVKMLKDKGKVKPGSDGPI